MPRQPVVAANTPQSPEAAVPVPGEPVDETLRPDPLTVASAVPADSGPRYFDVEGETIPVPGTIDAATARIDTVAPQPTPVAQPQPTAAASEPTRNRNLLALFGNNADRRTAARMPTNASPVSSRFHGPVVRIDPKRGDQRPIVAASATGSLVDRRRARPNSVRNAGQSGQKPVQVASAAGLARVVPHGLNVQHDRVDVQCLKPALVRVLKQIERHYGEKVVITSGYRSPTKNKKTRGSKNSLHMYCSAADIQIEGVSKHELATFVRSMPGRGGVGTYCHTQSVHVDIGPERDWNWRCRKRKR